MLQRQPSERIRPQQVLEHPWVAGAERHGEDAGDTAAAAPHVFGAELLSEEERDGLVQLMVDGGLGDRQDIVR